MFEVGRLVARIQLDGEDQFASGLNKGGKAFSDLDEKGQKAATNVGTALTLVGGAILGVVGVAVSKFAEFDKAMSEVNAVTQTTASNQHKLRAAALEAGAATVYSATEAADAETSLAKAGVQTADIIGGALTGALALAAAGQVAVGDAADTAATAMTQFNLTGSKVPHIADLLAAGAGKAQGGVDDLSLALKQSGLVASQFGLSVEDTVGALSAFASAGLIGSDAGTSFKQALLSLANPSQQARDAMKQWNIEAYDAQGNFVGLTSLAGQLQTGFAGATQAQRDQALATIFGTDAIRVANVLYKEGSAGIADWTAKVNDSGYAARQAAALQDNLAGDVEKLGGSLDTAFIQTGAAANDVMRSMVQWLTQLVDAYGQLDPQIQTTVLGVGALTGGIALLVGGLLIAIPKVVEFQTALDTLSTTSPRAAAGIRNVTTAIKLVPQVAVLAFISNMTTEWLKQTRVAMGLSESVETLNDKFKKGISTDVIDKQLNDSLAGWNTGIDQLHQLTDTGWLAGFMKNSYDFVGTLNDWNPVFNQVGSGATDLSERVKNLDQSLADQVKAGNAAEAADAYAYLKTKTDGSAEALQNLANLFPEYQKAAQDAVDGTDASAEASATAATAYQAQADNVQNLDDKLGQLIDTINAANGVGQDAVTANADYQKALADVADTIQKAKEGADGYSLSLDQGTAAGAANASMFADLAKKSQDAAQAQFDVDHNAQKFQANLVAGRQALIDRITDMTGNRAAAEAFADSVYRIPTKREFQLIADTATAQAQVNGFIKANDGRRLSVYVDAVGGQTYQAVDGAGHAISPKFNANGGILHYFAGGGKMENHVAQTVPAGSWRVFGEPETRGELYAPLAPEKRNRSMAVIASQLDQWGYDVVPKTERKGGAPAPASAPRAGGGTFTGNLYLDSGQFLGTVRGVVDEELDDERRAFDNGKRPGELA